MQIDLLDIFEKNKINYSEIKKELYFKNPTDKKFDISIIVPVRDRLQFTEPLMRHFNRAIENTVFSISITYVEHSVLPAHLRSCPVSYIWIPCNPDSRFNKCLCFNIGFISGPRADYYIFHDSDLLPQENFFGLIEKQLLSNTPSFQTFQGRRVLYADTTLTQKVLQGKAMLDATITGVHPNITIGQPGAPGGSILTTREMFLKVGGYDPEYFTGYSVEDQFFYDKLSVFSKVQSLEHSELLHLNHGDSHARTEDFCMRVLHAFQGMSFNEKKAFIDLKSEYFKTLL